MTMKRDPQKFMDPAVESVMSGVAGDPVYGGIERARRNRNMTPGKRAKLARDAQRVRATYDMPEAIRDLIDKRAAEESVPVSQMAVYYLECGLEGRQPRLIKKPSKSPKYDWVLDFVEMFG